MNRDTVRQAAEIAAAAMERAEARLRARFTPVKEEQ